MKPDKRAVATGFLLLLFLPSCDENAPRSDELPPAGQTVATSPSSPVSVEQPPVPLTKPFRYPDGLEVEVVGIQHGQLGDFPSTDDPNAKKGDPYTVVTVALRNRSADVIDTVLLGDLRYGPEKTRAYRIAMEDNGGMQSLEPDQASVPYDMGFLVPVSKRHDVVLEVSIELGSRQPARFAGSLERKHRG